MDPMSNSMSNLNPNPTSGSTPAPTPSSVSGGLASSGSVGAPAGWPSSIGQVQAQAQPAAPVTQTGQINPLVSTPQVSASSASIVSAPQVGQTAASSPDFSNPSAPVVPPAVPSTSPVLSNPALMQAPVNPVVRPGGTNVAGVTNSAFQPTSLGGVAATEPIMMPEPASAPDPVEEELKAPMRAAGPVPGSIGSAVSGPEAAGAAFGVGAEPNNEPFAAAPQVKTPSVSFADPTMKPEDNAAVKPAKKKSSKTTLIALIIVAMMVVIALAAVLFLQMNGGGLFPSGSSSGSNSNSNSATESVNGTTEETVVDDDTSDDTIEESEVEVDTVVDGTSETEPGGGSVTDGAGGTNGSDGTSSSSTVDTSSSNSNSVVDSNK